MASEHSTTWKSAFDEREDLKALGSAGLAMFAMALKFGYDDLDTIAADAVVDGPDDKGCDVVYIDRDARVAIIAQSYKAESEKASAKDSKAATLRQGASYLVEVDIDLVPERLKASAATLRSALKDGALDAVYVWFVHNCPASANVEKEIATVGQSVAAIIKSQFEGSKVSVFSEEIATETFEKLYTDTSTPILVDDEVDLGELEGFSFSEGEWSCFVAPIQVSVLRDLYRKFKTDLFSANVRDFLGLKAAESNINHQMRNSLKDKPSNFFVYNNGLTVLTHKVERDGKRVRVRGLSIVNGAQTTGTIGTSPDDAPADAYVLARFISTTNEDLISDVVRFNNSQNSVTASDFRSTDPIQRRLVTEMRTISDAEYDGGRRGGVSAAIKRRPKLLPSYSVGQAIAATHGDPTVSYNEKSAIWSKDVLYSRYFNDQLTAAHIVFCYGLLRAIEGEKASLRVKEALKLDLTTADRAKLEFYRRRGSVFLLCAAVGECLETITGKVVPNRFVLTFGPKTSPEQAAAIWTPTVEALAGLHNYLAPAFSDGLKNAERVRDTVKTYSQIAATLSQPFEPFFKKVSERIVLV